MECNVVVPDYMRPGRGILESDEILAKDNQRDQLIESSLIAIAPGDEPLSDFF